MRWLVDRKLMLPMILGLAFLLRAGGAIVLEYLLVHHWHRPFLIEGDANGYWDLGHKLATEGEFAVHEPPRRVMRMPGFPAVLALSMKIAGDSRLFARMLLAVVGTAACALVYWLGKELQDSNTGLWAALLTALSPTMMVFSVLILSETLFAAVMLASLIALARLVQLGFQPECRGQGLRLALFAGIWIALACYVRPSWLLVGPGFAVLYAIVSNDRRQAVVRGAVLLVGMLVALMPWTVRNYHVTGHVVPTTLWVGPSLYDGLNPQATGDSDMRFFEQDNLLEVMSEYEMDHAYRRRAWQFVVEHPGQTFSLALMKLKRFWLPWPNAPQFESWWQKLIVGGYALPMFVLAAWGWWKTRHRFWLTLLAAGPILYFSLIHMVFVSSLRYRLPAEYPLYVLSAIGLECLRRRLGWKPTTEES